MKKIYALAACIMFSAAAIADDQSPVTVANLQAAPGPTPSISYITGTATNTKQKALGNVFVHFNLYDANNALVGNAIATASNLAPNDTWKFSAGVTVPYDHFVLVKVDTY
ncbi:FxLYD domain-containing protein [Pseudomonas amygdali pv. morsprunorum]|uniref:FxLYD domain-containing protein n=1 Tax=Pseudomonas amygdali TaxID=47877 RepID=UPI00288CC28A|nr:FxLYD domain-containing protein [Pseudomonas amygdali]MDT3268722.1 FxLYD domain-containing protein [Pseudomonas amygdali pv. morsprunorum]